MMSCWWYGTLTHDGTRNMKITVASACWEPTVGLIAFTARSGGPRIPSADRWGWHATRPRHAGTTRRDPWPRRAHAYVQLASCARAQGAADQVGRHGPDRATGTGCLPAAAAQGPAPNGVVRRRPRPARPSSRGPPDRTADLGRPVVPGPSAGPGDRWVAPVWSACVGS